MLSIPSTGFAHSVNKHNVDLDALCDWIEGSVLFDGEVSNSDIVDTLRENEIYATQALAWEMVEHSWRELKRRIGWLGSGSIVAIQGGRVRPKDEWVNAPAHAFCLCLSFAKWYPKWAADFGKDYTEQGELFELLTIESLRFHFPNWEVHTTGWSRSHTKKLAEVVNNVATLLGEPIGQLTPWTKASANEAGLDILCFRSFNDDRSGAPVLLVQCASGQHYDGKLHTPCLRTWKRIVNFTADPVKAFSTPFALTDVEFKRVANLVNGMLLDRYRLLSPARERAYWVSAELGRRIIPWVAARIKTLPRAEQ